MKRVNFNTSRGKRSKLNKFGALALAFAMGSGAFFGGAFNVKAAEDPTASADMTKEFNGDPGYYYLSTHDDQPDSPIGSVWEYNPNTKAVTKVTTNLMEDGKTLREYSEANAEGMNLTQDNGVSFEDKAEKYAGTARFNALGISSDGKKAYGVSFIGTSLHSNDNGKNFIEGVYEYDLDKAVWKEVFSWKDDTDKRFNLTTNSITAGAVNPKDGKFYFGAIVQVRDSAYEEVSPKTPEQLTQWYNEKKAGDT